MRGPLLALCFVALSLAWLVLFGAGVRQADWDAALLFLGATALFYWSFRTGQMPPRLPTWQTLALWALPCYAAFELIPMPPGLLEILSPARALITGNLAGVVPSLSHAPVSVAPAASLAGLFSLLGYLTVFSLMRDIKWRFAEGRPWLTAAPLVVLATLESSIGIGQWLAGSPNTSLRGTLANSEHFAGLLEMALPFAIIYGFICFRRHQTRLTTSAVPAARAATSWFAALLILVALFHSSSQASHIIVFASLFILLAFALVPRLKTKRLRWYGAACALAAALVIFFYVTPPDDFVSSLAQLGATAKTPAEATLNVWNDAESLFSDFRWLGTGIGGFEPTFLKYQGSADLSRVQNPHSDVLSLLITWGILGASILCVALAGVIRPAVTGALFLQDERRRLLAVSITASLVAVLLRGCIESTLSVPVLAMTFAWLAGLGQSSGLD